MKKLIILILSISIYKLSAGQNYYTKNGYISFYSKAAIENIKADNNQVVCILNAQDGQLQFSLLIKNFHFEKSLMEEHFNENYLESDKFPKSTFKGKVTDINTVNFKKDGEYIINVTGELTLHNITKTINTPGVVTIKEGLVYVSSKFSIHLEDYDIIISKAVKNNISDTPEITVFCFLNDKK